MARRGVEGFVAFEVRHIFVDVAPHLAGVVSGCLAHVATIFAMPKRVRRVFFKDKLD